jgi:hypothetical protein
MCRYAQIFCDEEIGFDALSCITEQDLVEMGVRLGSRRKILSLRPVNGTSTPEFNRGLTHCVAACTASSVGTRAPLLDAGDASESGAGLFRSRFRLVGNSIRGSAGEVCAFFFFVPLCLSC